MEKGRGLVELIGNHDCSCEWSNPEAWGGKARFTDKS